MIASVTSSVTSTVASHGVYVIFALMAIDAVLPAGSELVMVFGGALAAGAIAGHHVEIGGTHIASVPAAYLVVSLAGTLGYLLGSLLGWQIGMLAGRPLLERHGRWLHLDGATLARADAWFARYGSRAVLLGRITPVIRSFVSIPAGALGMSLSPYMLWTAIGSAAWSFALAGVGLAVGRSYERFHHGFDVLTVVIVALLGLLTGSQLVGKLRTGGNDAVGRNTGRDHET